MIMVELATKRNNSPKETTICSFFLPISHKECFESSDLFIPILLVSFLSLCVIVMCVSVRVVFQLNLFFFPISKQNKNLGFPQVEPGNRDTSRFVQKNQNPD